VTNGIEMFKEGENSLLLTHDLVSSLTVPT
jgi:hypothetical protein